MSRRCEFDAPSAGSLPDAEAAEDAIQHVVGIDRAGHLAEFLQGDANLGRQQFFAGMVQHKLLRPRRHSAVNTSD